jgi:hypothetical protein
MTLIATHVSIRVILALILAQPENLALRKQWKHLGVIGTWQNT